MLQIYGSPLSSPTNKVRYVANYLGLPFEFRIINLGAGEQRQPEYLKINPLAKVPAIDDNGFCLGESNAIIRYLADKAQNRIYPKDLQQRAIVDQWIDYASQHVMLSLTKIMFNMHFYQFANIAKDERSLEDGRKFIGTYLPVLEQQLTKNKYMAGSTFTLADIVMIASLDVCEMCKVDLSVFPHLSAWRNKLMTEAFYTKCHPSYSVMFENVMKMRKSKVE